MSTIHEAAESALLDASNRALGDSGGSAGDSILCYYDFERAATRLGMNMTVDGSGGAEIRLQGVENYSFCDADGGANGAASSGDDDSSVDDSSDASDDDDVDDEGAGEEGEEREEDDDGSLSGGDDSSDEDDTAEYTTDVRAAEAPVGSAPPHFSSFLFSVT